MRIYYPDLYAIEQQTRQLAYARCRHCQGTHQLMSHGFIYKKRHGAAPAAVGKRVFCSNRDHHTGCGRTMRLYLDTTIRYLHHSACALSAFVLALMSGASVRRAFADATGTAEARHAWRWLARLHAQLSCYRSIMHQTPLQSAPTVPPSPRPVRRRLLESTCATLMQRFGPALCASYQQHRQQPFL